MGSYEKNRRNKESQVEGERDDKKREKRMTKKRREGDNKNSR